MFESWTTLEEDYILVLLPVPKPVKLSVLSLIFGSIKKLCSPLLKLSMFKCPNFYLWPPFPNFPLSFKKRKIFKTDLRYNYRNTSIFYSQGILWVGSSPGRRILELFCLNAFLVASSKRIYQHTVECPNTGLVWYLNG
jgi:hypothetical protein